jgi:hypothetical protein
VKRAMGELFGLRKRGKGSGIVFNAGDKRRFEMSIINLKPLKYGWYVWEGVFCGTG